MDIKLEVSIAFIEMFCINDVYLVIPMKCSHNVWRIFYLEYGTKSLCLEEHGIILNIMYGASFCS